MRVAALLAEGARFNDEIHRLPIGSTTHIPEPTREPIFDDKGHIVGYKEIPSDDEIVNDNKIR